VIERATADPNVRRIVDDVRLFDGLHDHVGWRRLREIVKENKRTFLRRFAERLMAGEEVGSDEIAFHRGFYMGAEWITGHPEEAIKSLEQAAVRAYSHARREAMSINSQEESPYV
jgi:hypothetical protein